MVAAAIAGAAVVGAGASYAASRSASGAAKKGAAISSKDAATDRALQWKMYQQQRTDAEKYYGKGRADLTAGYAQGIKTLDPYDNNGVAATNRLAALAGVGGGAAQTAALRSDPGYQFRMTEGVNALDRSAASRGMLLSGAQAKGLNDYGQGMASEELNNAFNRTSAVADAARGTATNIANLQTGRGNALANLATGQSTQLNNLSTNTTQGITTTNRANTANQVNAQNNIGQARASGYTGAANAVNSGISNGLFYHGLQQGWFRQ